MAEPNLVPPSDFMAACGEDEAPEKAGSAVTFLLFFCLEWWRK
jgi:hypothetical protein